MEHDIRIVIADDHPIFRAGLRQVIESAPGMVVVAEAAHGGEAVAAVEAHDPDVLVLDVDMPVMDGLTAAREVGQRRQRARIVFLTMYREEDLFNEALDAGGMGYIPKDNAAREILNAIAAVMRNEYYICPSMSRFLVERSRRARSVLAHRPSLETLTATERRILRLIVDNRTSKEIGDVLGISYRTVENHRTNISRKLELHGSHALLKFAFDNKHLL